MIGTCAIAQCGRKAQVRLLWARATSSASRAKAEALPGMDLSPVNGLTVRLVDLDKVLALFDGGSDD